MKILIIRYSSLGDVILTTSVPVLIHKLNPEAEIDVLTKKEYFPVFKYNEHINNIYDKPPVKEKYDLLIDLHDSIRSNAVNIFLRSIVKKKYNKASFARRVFLHSGRRDALLNKSVIERYQTPVYEYFDNKNEVSSAPYLSISENEKKRVLELTEEKKFIALIPGAKWPSKQWTIENYRSFVIKTVRELGFNVVILGDQSDIRLSLEIMEGVGLLKKHVFNLTGQTSMREYFSLLDMSEVIVTTDSSGLHAGWALSKDVIALFGPTVKEFGFQPMDDKVHIIEKDLQCRPCSLHGEKKCKFTDKACIQRIEVHEVFNLLKKILKIKTGAE